MSVVLIGVCIVNPVEPSLLSLARACLVSSHEAELQRVLRDASGKVEEVSHHHRTQTTSNPLTPAIFT
jgi:hypothetical protein